MVGPISRVPPVRRTATLGPELNLLRDAERVIDLDGAISDGTFRLGRPRRS
jgi:hypothetical protein